MIAKEVGKSTAPPHDLAGINQPKPVTQLEIEECWEIHKDHSDSDLKAAANANVPYMDVDDFIEKYYENRHK